MGHEAVVVGGVPHGVVENEDKRLRYQGVTLHNPREDIEEVAELTMVADAASGIIVDALDGGNDGARDPVVTEDSKQHGTIDGIKCFLKAEIGGDER